MSEQAKNGNCPAVPPPRAWDTGTLTKNAGQPEGQAWDTPPGTDLQSLAKRRLQEIQKRDNARDTGGTTAKASVPEPSGPWDTFRAPKSGSQPTWLHTYRKTFQSLLDAGENEIQARRTAYWTAVQTWEAENPLVPPSDGMCLSCGHPVRDDVGCVVKDGSGTYRMHDTCGQRLHRRRQDEARTALARYGIIEK